MNTLTTITRSLQEKIENVLIKIQNNYPGEITFKGWVCSKCGNYNCYCNNVCSCGSTEKLS